MPYENEIKFIEDVHKYIYKRDESLVFRSVTQTLTDYFFDEFTGDNSCRKNIYEENAMLAAWVSAAYFGTTIHYYLEKLMRQFSSTSSTETVTCQKKWTELQTSNWYKEITETADGYKLMLNGLIDKDQGNDEHLNYTLLRRRLERDCGKHVARRKHLHLDDMVDQTLCIFRSLTWLKQICNTLKAFADFITKPETNSTFFCDDQIKEKILQLFVAPIDILAPEFIVYDRQWLIAGTVDLLVWTNRAERRIAVIDWKTNQLDLCANKYPVKATASPFYRRYLNSWEKYKCQLHIYAKILERNYMVCVDYIIVVHVVKEGVKIYAEPFNNCECVSHLEKIKSKK